MASERPEKTQPRVTAETVQMVQRMRFNPIRGLDPAKLSIFLDQFDAGYLSGLALLMEKIEERDNVLQAVAPKRKKSLARHGWQIQTIDDTPEATKQKEAAEYFFHNLTATSAIDEDQSGGVSLLMSQMMDAEGKRWAAHEIIYQPRPEGLTAQLRFVPLWFFEHTSSRLRYLPTSGSISGDPLSDGEWMVTRGSGLMIACAILYTFKRLPLQDLLNYCERYAVPGLHGQTDAAKGSDEWNTLRDALAQFGMDWALLTNTAAKISPVDVSAKGELPHPKIIDWCDRAMTILWRGGDLSTMSAGNSVGASVQGDETDILEDSDISLIEETINRKLLPYVLRYAVGSSNVQVKFSVNRPNRADQALEITKDQFLLQAGCPIAKSDLLTRHGRTMPAAGEELAVWSPAMAAAPAGTPAGAPLVNAMPANRAAAARILDARRLDQVLAAGRVQLSKAEDAVMRPIADRIVAAFNSDDQEAGIRLLVNLRNDLPGIFEKIMADTAMADVIENTMATALVNGYAAAAVARQVPADGGEATT